MPRTSFLGHERKTSITGTHTGLGLGVSPTGRSVRITGMVMIRTSGGRTVEGWSSFDMLGLFDQLGVVKRPKLG
jgi:predicted ester cyclase